MTAKVNKLLKKLAYSKAEWSWNRMYQDLYNKAKGTIKQDACMKFYHASSFLYLETDVSGISLGAGLLQVRESKNCGWDKVPDNVTLCWIALASKSLLNAEHSYNNIKWEALGILNGLNQLLLFCQGSICNNRPQTFGSHGQQ